MTDGDCVYRGVCGAIHIEPTDITAMVVCDRFQSPYQCPRRGGLEGWAACTAGVYCNAYARLLLPHVEERNKPRHIDCSDARSLCAQSCGYSFSCVSQWLLKRLDRRNRRTVTSASVTCLRHSCQLQLSRTDAERVAKSFRKSMSRATSRWRRRWATSLVERARPHDSGMDPVRACHGSHLPAALRRSTAGSERRS